jgi:O-antigen/teichoic acid export membrane protein
MLTLSLNSISSLFGTVMYPSLKMFKSDGGDINREYESILCIIGFICFAISVLLILAPKIIVILLWGENWIKVSELLPFFGILILFQPMLATTGQIYILLNEEKTFMKLGVFSAILLVLAIGVGSLFSVKIITISYTTYYLLILMPVALYVGFIRTFGFSWTYIMKFWFPEIVLGNSLLISLIFDKRLWIIVLMILYLFHLINYQKEDIIKLKNLFITKIREN